MKGSEKVIIILQTHDDKLIRGGSMPLLGRVFCAKSLVSGLLPYTVEIGRIWADQTVNVLCSACICAPLRTFVARFKRRRCGKWASSRFTSTVGIALSCAAGPETGQAFCPTPKRSGDVVTKTRSTVPSASKGSDSCAGKTEKRLR